MTRGDKRYGVPAILDNFRGETAKGMAGANPALLGLDFSGAVNAGRKIWLTDGQVAGDALHVTQFHNRGICR